MEAPPSHSEAMQPAEYAALAAVEDRLWYFRSLHRLVAGELGRTLGSGPAALLDAGCGTGGLMRRLGAARPGWTWTGVEASPVACAYARDQGAGNVIEAALLAILGKRWEDVSDADYERLLRELALKPRVVDLQAGGAG